MKAGRPRTSAGCSKTWRRDCDKAKRETSVLSRIRKQRQRPRWFSNNLWGTVGPHCHGFVALIIAAAYRKLTLQNVKEAAYTTLTVTVMVFFIIAGAVFNAVFLFLGGGALIKSMLMSLPFGDWFVLSVMMFILFILGFFISWQGLLFIVVPIFLPVAAKLGFNPLWFGILICLNLQMSFLTPPFAYAIFFVKGASPPEINTWDIYRGVIPFVFLQAASVAVCILFPEIILWLPRVTLAGAGG
ncbi:MAG: TRAP transporter large permease subunit [Deltaproteobacteria bacterium]|nr:TRAP transporter large permease subunit [Deltaproteobacteria bacterium]